MGPSQHDGGERLVDLDDVDIAEREVIALEDLLGGRDRAGQHHHRVIADQHRIHHARGAADPMLRTDRRPSTAAPTPRRRSATTCLRCAGRQDDLSG